VIAGVHGLQVALQRPYAYSYADDDATSTFACKGRCDYRITFGLTPAG